MTTADDATAVARSYLAAFTSGDPDAVVAHVSADFVNEHRSTLGSSCVGRLEYRRRLPRFFADFPGLRYDVVDVVADGDRVVVAYTMRADPPGGAIAVPGVMWFTVGGGLITHRTDLFDGLAAT